MDDQARRGEYAEGQKSHDQRVDELHRPRDRLGPLLHEVVNAVGAGHRNASRGHESESAERDAPSSKGHAHAVNIRRFTGVLQSPRGMSAWKLCIAVALRQDNERWTGWIQEKPELTS